MMRPVTARILPRGRRRAGWEIPGDLPAAGASSIDEAVPGDGVPASRDDCLAAVRTPGRAAFVTDDVSFVHVVQTDGKGDLSRLVQRLVRCRRQIGHAEIGMECGEVK